MGTRRLLLFTSCIALSFVAGCQQSPSLPVLSPKERGAVDLAQTFLAQEATDWGQPSRVARTEVEYVPGMTGADVYVVTYATPPDEVKLLGDRAVVVDIKTGRVRFVPRC